MHTMKIERLIKMANDIGDFFNAESNKEIAAEGVKKHILDLGIPECAVRLLLIVSKMELH